MAVFTFPNPSSLVFPSTGSGGGGITWATPIDSNITVDTNYTYDLGATGGGLNNVYAGAVYGPAGDNYVELGDNDILISSSVGPVTVQVADTEPFQVDTANSATNSGNITLTIGTAGVTQGDFKFLKSGDAPTVGDVWTATNVDGSGYWSAPSGGGANTTLSNLVSPTSINQDLILNTGAQAYIKTFDDPAGQSQNLDIGSGLAGSGFSTGQVTVRTGTSDAAVGYLELRGGDTSSMVDAGGSIFLTAGDGGTDSGDITLDPRTNGEIVLAHSSKGTAGHYWRSTDANGSGEWAAGGSGTVTSVALSAPSFLSVAGSPVTTSGTLALSLSGTPIRMADGTSGSPSYSFSGSTDTGMYASGTDLGLVIDGTYIIAFAVNGGTPSFKSSANNNIDLGTTTEAWKTGYIKNVYVRYGETRYYDSDLSNYVSLYPAAVVSSNVLLQLPASQGAAGTVMQNDGAGILSFSSMALQFYSNTSDPGSPVAGQVYYNSTSNKLKVYTGAAWETITSI